MNIVLCYSCKGTGVIERRPIGGDKPIKHKCITCEGSGRLVEKIVKYPYKG